MLKMETIITLIIEAPKQSNKGGPTFVLLTSKVAPIVLFDRLRPSEPFPRKRCFLVYDIAK